jgi:uncharacterized protein YdaU (DUF1376 family)
MSNLPFMAFYVDLYEGNTSHLTLEEDGFYNRLLRLLWRSPGCSIPDDAGWIMRKMRVDKETFYRVGAPIIEEFCSRRNGKITQKRLLFEWQKAFAKYEARKSAGKKGGTAKALKDKASGGEFARHLPWHKEEEKELQLESELEPEDSSLFAKPVRSSRDSIIDFQNRLKERGKKW